jgi:hypothetical protein
MNGSDAHTSAVRAKHPPLAAWSWTPTASKLPTSSSNSTSGAPGTAFDLLKESCSA